jgi:hypothetical protein
MPAPKVKTVKPAPKAKTAPKAKAKPAPKAKAKPALKAKAVKSAPKAKSIKVGGFDQKPTFELSVPLKNLLKLPQSVRHPSITNDMNRKEEIQRQRTNWMRNPNNMEQLLQLNKDIITSKNIFQLRRIANLTDEKMEQLYEKKLKQQRQQNKTGGGSDFPLFSSDCPTYFYSGFRDRIKNKIVFNKGYAYALYSAGVPFQHTAYSKDIMNRVESYYKNDKNDKYEKYHMNGLYTQLNEMFNNIGDIYIAPKYPRLDSFINDGYKYYDPNFISKSEEYLKYVVCKINKHFNRTEQLDNQNKITISDQEMQELITMVVCNNSRIRKNSFISCPQQYQA